MDLSNSTAALFFGFILGLKHATDVDHVVAVSTIVSKYRNPWRSIWVGVSWGLGHTAPLIAVGIVILLLKDAFPPAESFSRPLEFIVGIMLVFLGGQVFWNLFRRPPHLHQHEASHVHVHSHRKFHDGQSLLQILHPRGAGKPFFRLKSFVIGVVHGLAGSAIVLLVLLANVSFHVGIGLILLFGLGTTLSMAAITLVISIPFALSSSHRVLNYVLIGLAGFMSVGTGIYIVYNIGVAQRLLI